MQSNRLAVYLASPYTHADPAVMDMRYRAAARVAGWLMERGFIVFSPIAMTVPIEREINNHNHAFWMNQDFEFCDRTDALIVLMLPGVEWSAGVAMEEERFRSAAKPVMHLPWEVVSHLFNSDEVALIEKGARR